MSVVREAGRVLRHVWTHPANAERRLRSVARAVGFQLRGRFGRRTMTRIGRRGRMWVDLHWRGASAALYANPPDWNEMLAWARLLRPGDLFVDVGSNVGSYALWAGDSGAEVIAVEPSPETAARLRENVALNDFRITVRQCALAERPGRMRLTRDADTTNHLLLDPDAAGDGVEVDTLDNVLGDRHARGVKIDVEGAERVVLEGARRALAERRIDLLQIEWNGMSELTLRESRAPVAGILSEYGYRFARPDSRGQLRDIPAPLVSREDVFAVVPGLQL